MSRPGSVLDLHVDSIIQQRLFRYRVTHRHARGLPGQPLFWHADVPRMKEADYRGACLGIHFWPWESERGFREMQRQIDYLDTVIAADNRVLRVREPADWERAHAQSLLALAPGVEGAHMLNGRIERVEELKRRQVAYMTLTHFSANAAATPSMGRGANEHDGLKAFGHDLVAALQEANIVVDVAHVNTPGVLDVCKISRAPIMCTHTGVKGVCDHARNITDEEIDAIAETGGVIGIMFAPVFLAGTLRATSDIVIDHIEYVIDRVGIEHVAIGSDYDGWLPSIPSDQKDCRDVHVVREKLADRGHSVDDIDRILGQNAADVLSGARGAQ